MEPTKTKGDAGRILVVDDDPSGLKFFALSLEKGGFEVITALSAALAKKVIKQEGVQAFDCVLTDYRMPGENGIDLLNWLQEQDPSLATIIVTAEGEMNLVQDSLRGGAVDFLEKPVKRLVLENAVLSGIEHSKRQRALESNNRSVHAVSQMNQIFEAVRAPALQNYLAYASNPHQEVGGDFINILPVGKSRYAFIIGDVSGHDVRAAFVSAYFQGMVRGLLERNSTIEEIVPLFNGILNEEWSALTRSKKADAVPIMTSLGVFAAILDLENNKLSMLTCGMPAPYLLDAQGRIFEGRKTNPPLGWFDEWEFEGEELQTSDLLFLYVCTDGLQDYASDLSINSLSLLYKILESDLEKSQQLLSAAQDDVLVMRFQMDHNSQLKDLPQPVIYEQYTGEEHTSIDKLQNIWRRSLQFVLSKEYDERLYDMLLCLRECVLNAMMHGCESSGEKQCSLSVTFDEREGLLRFRIDDPGHGHGFDVNKRIDEMTEFKGEHLGLTIISQLSDACTLQNEGSTVIFDFKVSPV